MQHNLAFDYLIWVQLSQYWLANIFTEAYPDFLYLGQEMCNGVDKGINSEKKENMHL